VAAHLGIAVVVIAMVAAGNNNNNKTMIMLVGRFIGDGFLPQGDNTLSLAPHALLLRISFSFDSERGFPFGSMLPTKMSLFIPARRFENVCLKHLFNFTKNFEFRRFIVEGRRDTMRFVGGRTH